MPFVELDRRFVELQEGKTHDPEVSEWLGIQNGMGWADVLKKRRVVLLAEASGKSAEM